MAPNYYFDPDDKLNRFGFAKFLRDLIEHSSEYKRDDSSNAYSIAIDSSWGTGKTYFFSMFENYLYGQRVQTSQQPTATPEFAVVNYNAWTNDYWDDAFAPFMQAILDNDRFMGTNSNAKFRRLANSILENIELLPVKTYYTYRKSNPLADLRKMQNNIQDLKKCLSSLIEEIQSNGVKKLVIIIDELDRCKPLFAIQTLEIVKHFLDVEDVVFIFAVDLEQLSHSVKTIYGSEMDASGYLCKFFDYITKFPQPDFETLLNQYIDNTPDLLGNIHSRHDPSSDFISFTKTVVSCFHLSIRDLHTVLQSYKIMLRNFLSEYVLIEAHQIYFFLLVLKYKYPLIFNKLFYSQVSQNLSNIGFPDDLKPLMKKAHISEILNYISGQKAIKISVKHITFEMNETLTFNPRNDTLYGEIHHDEYTIQRQSAIIPEDFKEQVLFYPDIAKNLNNLKNTTYSDYYFKRLENFDFPEIIKGSEK